MAKKAPLPDPPPCLHCDQPSVAVSGRVIYPNRPDLHGIKLYACHPCQAYVGCHKKTDEALGYPGNAEVRRARKYVHNVLDPIWENARYDPAYAGSYKDTKAIQIITRAARNRTYRWLAHKMRIPQDRCHTAMFGVEECREAWRHCNGTPYSTVRDWHKENPPPAKEPKK